MLASFPLAALIALVFRFPIPFNAYLSGPTAMLPASMAVVFYGVMGGFPVQAAMGGVGAVVGSRFSAGDRQRRAAIIGAVVAAIPGLVVLAVLDYIIGPW